MSPTARRCTNGGSRTAISLEGVVVLLPIGRRFALGRVWPLVKQYVSGIGNVASRPSKVLALFGGSLVITTSYILALWYSVEAFGGGIGFVSVGAVYLGGQAVARAAPTPGGIGGGGGGVDCRPHRVRLGRGGGGSGSLPAPFATFWLPILPGWIAMRHLLRIGVL